MGAGEGGRPMAAADGQIGAGGAGRDGMSQRDLCHIGVDGRHKRRRNLFCGECVALAEYGAEYRVAYFMGRHRKEALHVSR